MMKSSKKPLSMIMYTLILLTSILVSISITFYCIRININKIKNNEIINSIYNKGVDKCQKLIEVKSEN
jgi:hypothetical protein